MLIGYARVSTEDQNLDLQRDALENAGCEQIFTDRVSGTKARRPGLEQALSHLRAGDTLVVRRLDRLGRSLRHLIDTVTELQEKGIGFKLDFSHLRAKGLEIRFSPQCASSADHKVPTLLLPTISMPFMALHPTILRGRLFEYLQASYRLDDFLRVVGAERDAKSHKGLRRTLNRCGVLHGKMAKVELRACLVSNRVRVGGAKSASLDGEQHSSEYFAGQFRQFLRRFYQRGLSNKSSAYAGER
jgi:Resolvase, N terminal domain